MQKENTKTSKISKNTKEKNNDKRMPATMEQALIPLLGAVTITGINAALQKVLLLVITTTITQVPVIKATIQAQLHTITSPNIKQ
jgi:hypothetical protein